MCAPEVEAGAHHGRDGCRDPDADRAHAYYACLAPRSRASLRTCLVDSPTHVATRDLMRGRRSLRMAEDLRPGAGADSSRRRLDGVLAHNLRLVHRNLAVHSDRADHSDCVVHGGNLPGDDLARGSCYTGHSHSRRGGDCIRDHRDDGHVLVKGADASAADASCCAW